MLFGYARVSTIEQETNLQLDALLKAGAQKIFSEKASAVGKRPELDRLLSIVGKGDVVLVYKIDRLARSLKHLLSILDRLESVGCGLRSVSEPIDTHSLAGRMTLQMLGAVAEFERGLIRERTAAGMRAAKARGVQLGRPRMFPPEVEADIVERVEVDGWTHAECAAMYGISEHSVGNAVYRARGLISDRGVFRTRNTVRVPRSNRKMEPFAGAP